MSPRALGKSVFDSQCGNKWESSFYTISLARCMTNMNIILILIKNHFNLNNDLSYIANNFDNSGHIIVIAKKDNSLGWNYVLM